MKVVQQLLLCIILNEASTRRLVCYINMWAQYRPLPAKFLPGRADPFLCTHVIYGPAGLNGSSLQSTEMKFKELQKLRRSNPRLKVMLSVGGWDVGSVPFSNLVKTLPNIRKFAENSARFLRENGFDGLDVDWRFPTDRGSPSEDSEKYTMLLKDIRFLFEEEATASGLERLLLSAVVSGTKTTIDYAYDVKTITTYTDFLNVGSIELSGHWNEGTNHPNPLFPLSQAEGSPYQNRNMDWVAREWKKAGASPSHLNIGVSFHGLTFMLDSASTYDIRPTYSSSGPAGNYTYTKGSLAYFEICILLQGGGKKSFKSDQRVPILISGDLWVGYEDQESLSNKARYARDNGFGGIVVWNMDEDDFAGKFCNQGDYPLLRTVRQEFMVSPGLYNTFSEGDSQDRNTRSGILLSTTDEKGSGCGRIVCYVSNCGQLRDGPARFLPTQIEADLCTHYIYAHASLSGTRLVPQFPTDEEMYALMVQIRQLRNPATKVLLSVGGWDIGSAPFSRLVASKDALTVFAESAAIFLRETGFDGLDVDWQYPANRGSPPNDRERFTRFLQVLHTVFGRSGQKDRPLLLTVSLSGQHYTFTTAYQLPDIIKYVDFANFMTFDLHGTWEGRLEHHSPLNFFSQGDTNGHSDSGVKATKLMMTAGVDLYKVNFGLAFFGRTSTAVNNITINITSGPAGVYSAQKGYLSYFEICELVKNGAHTGWLAQQLVPYLRTDQFWVAYDDPRSIKEKVQYAVRSGYGGLSIWTVDSDDFNGQFCGQGTFPLLRAALETCPK